MDLIYDVIQLEENKLLLADDVADDPVFSFSLTNPWTGAVKSATIPKEGMNKDWVLVITGTTEALEDLSIGLIYFDNIGTWTGVLTAGSYSRNIDLQVV